MNITDYVADEDVNYDNMLRHARKQFEGTGFTIQGVLMHEDMYFALRQKELRLEAKFQEDDLYIMPLFETTQALLGVFFEYNKNIIATKLSEEGIRALIKHGEKLEVDPREETK